MRTPERARHARWSRVGSLAVGDAVKEEEVCCARSVRPGVAATAQGWRCSLIVLDEYDVETLSTETTDACVPPGDAIAVEDAWEADEIVERGGVAAYDAARDVGTAGEGGERRAAGSPETAVGVGEGLGDGWSVAEVALRSLCPDDEEGTDGDWRGRIGVANAARSVAGTVGVHGEVGGGVAGGEEAFFHLAVIVRRDFLRASSGGEWSAGDVCWYQK